MSPARTRRWTWSFTVHGPDEFYEVSRFNLRAKVESADFVVCISDFARSQLMALVSEEHWGKLQRDPLRDRSRGVRATGRARRHRRPSTSSASAASFRSRARAC